MKMMKPKRCPKQAFFILMMTVALVLVSAYSLQNAPELALYFRLIGGVALAVGAALLFRYTMTTYVYVLEDNVFSVRRCVGATERTVFSRELIKGDKLAVNKIGKKQSFRQNLNARCVYIVYHSAKPPLCVEIEPNDQFLLVLESTISKL